MAVELLNDWAAIFTVLSHPELPLTNNDAERALRHWVILRKLTWGTRTPVGPRRRVTRQRHRYLAASVGQSLALPARAIADRRAGLPSRPCRTWGVNDCKKSSVRCFDPFLKTLETYKNEVVNYFSDRLTSGFVEGLNNKIKVIKRRCYGLKNIGHLFQHLYLDLCGYSLYATKIIELPQLTCNLLRHKKWFMIDNTLFLNRIYTPGNSQRAKNPRTA
ncbi:MAG: transposase [Candidatus Competibacteraceae bacterium]|nr:transposase [Candidatus Competibacteraceae bacterium]